MVASNQCKTRNVRACWHRWITRMDDNGCNELSLLIIIPRGDSTTKTGTSHSPFLDPEPLWNPSQVQPPDRPSDRILLFCDLRQPVEVDRNTASSVFHPYHKRGGHWSTLDGENCLHPVFEVVKGYFKPEKPQDINGLRSLHVHCVLATVFHIFVEVIFRKLLWSGCILHGIVVGGCYPSLYALCWRRKQSEGPGSPWRRGLSRKRSVAGRLAVT